MHKGTADQHVEMLNKFAAEWTQVRSEGVQHILYLIGRVERQIARVRDDLPDAPEYKAPSDVQEKTDAVSQ